MAHGEQQGDAGIGVFNLGDAVCSAGENLLPPLQFEALSVPSSAGEMRTALDSVNPKSSCSVAGEAGEGIRDFQAALMGSQSERFGQVEFSNAFVQVANDSAKGQVGMKRLAAGQADLYLDERIKAA